MAVSRRTFLKSAAAVAATLAPGGRLRGGRLLGETAAEPGAVPSQARAAYERFDPWVEVIPETFRITWRRSGDSAAGRSWR